MKYLAALILFMSAVFSGCIVSVPMDYLRTDTATVTGWLLAKSQNHSLNHTFHAQASAARHDTEFYQLEVHMPVPIETDSSTEFFISIRTMKEECVWNLSEIVVLSKDNTHEQPSLDFSGYFASRNKRWMSKKQFDLSTHMYTISREPGQRKQSEYHEIYLKYKLTSDNTDNITLTFPELMCPSMKLSIPELKLRRSHEAFSRFSIM